MKPKQTEFARFLLILVSPGAARAGSALAGPGGGPDGGEILDTVCKSRPPPSQNPRFQGGCGRHPRYCRRKCRPGRHPRYCRRKCRPGLWCRTGPVRVGFQPPPTPFCVINNWFLGVLATGPFDSLILSADSRGESSYSRGSGDPGPRILVTVCESGGTTRPVHEDYSELGSTHPTIYDTSRAPVATVSRIRRPGRPDCESEHDSTRKTAIWHEETRKAPPRVMGIHGKPLRLRR